MAQETTDVLVAGYQDIEAATADFEALVALVKEKKVAIEGVILVTHAEDGAVAVRQTGDRMGRKGAGWGAGVGLAVGVFAPPLLAAVGVGAVAGGVIGKFVDHRVEHEIHDKIGENLPPGSAGIIAVFDDEHRFGVEQALAGAAIRSVVETDKQGVAALKGSLAEAMGKFSPDRSVLPIPDPNFGGTIGRTLEASIPDWTINMTPSPPEGAPNVLLVLLDDAGFANPSTFGGPVATPDDDAGCRAGAEVQPLPRDGAVLADAGRAAHGPQPSHGRLRLDRRAARPVPRLHGERAEGLRLIRAGAAGQRLLDRRVRQVAPDARPPSGCRRAVRPLADRLGFRPLLGFPRRRGRPVRPGHHPGQHDDRACRREAGKGYYLPDDLTDQAVRWLHEVRAQDQEKPWFMYYSTGCAHAPHQVAVEWSEKYRGKFDQGWDRLREETFERQKQLGVIPPEAELTPRPDALPAWDSLSDNEKKLYARQMEVFAGYEENADWNVGRLLDAIEELGELDNTLVLYVFGDNGASLEGTITGSFNELTMQNGIALTPAAAALADRAIRRPRCLGHRRLCAALRAGLGVGRQRPVPVGQAGRLPPRRHAQPDGRVLARADQGRRRDPVAVHALHRHRPDDPRSGGAARGKDRRRHRAEADGGDELPLQLRRRGCRRAAHGAVLRDLREPRDLQGRLVGRVHARPDPVGRLAADDGKVRAGHLRPRAGHVGALLPARRLQPGERRRGRAPREARRVEGALLAGGGEAQRAAAVGRLLGLLRHPAADADRRRHTRSTATSRTSPRG